MQNRLVLLTALSMLGGCSAPGLDGLKANSVHQIRIVKGDPRRLASCVATQFDSAPNGLGEIAMPAEGWREPEDGVIQIFNSAYSSQTASPGAFAYFATFRKKGEYQVEIDIYASRDVHIALPSNYVIDWFNKHVNDCAQRIASG